MAQALNTNDKPIIGYLLDSLEYNRLQGVLRGLYGDGTHLTPDRRRDLANAMHAALFSAMPLREGEL